MTKKESTKAYRISWADEYFETPSLLPGGGGTPGNSWWCAARCSKSWPYFRSKNVICHPCFQTRPLETIPVFRPGRYVIITLIRAQNKKNSSSPFRIRMFLFLSYSFGIETINTFIDCRSSLENHTRPQTKMVKVNTRFLTKTAQKRYPMGRDIPI